MKLLLALPRWLSGTNALAEVATAPFTPSVQSMVGDAELLVPGRCELFGHRQRCQNLARRLRHGIDPAAAPSRHFGQQLILHGNGAMAVRFLGN